MNDEGVDKEHDDTLWAHAGIAFTVAAQEPHNHNLPGAFDYDL